MNLPTPNGDDAPRGNLDDALEAEDRIKALAHSAPHADLPESPFSPATTKERSFSLSISPLARGLTINTEHPLQSTVEEVGGKITLSIKW